jgi:hypothetical protein
MELANVDTVIMAGQGCDETILNLCISISQLGPFTAGSTGDNFSESGWTRNAVSETFLARGCNSRTVQRRVRADTEGDREGLVR